MLISYMQIFILNGHIWYPLFTYWCLFATNSLLVAISYVDTICFFKEKRKTGIFKKKIKQHSVHLHSVYLESLFRLEFIILGQ